MSIDRGDQPGAGDDLVDPQPGSREHLGRRLGNLSPGHPSFPHDSFPAGSDRRSERPRPLTDAEHADHVRDIRASLDKARANGLATDVQHTIDPAREVWSADRDAIHDAIIADLYARAADVPCERKAILAGGLAGAGKSTVLQDHAGIDQSQYLTLNPDEIKEQLALRGLVPQVPGLSPMEATNLAHEESSHLAKRLARHARADGKNTIWDITMSSRSSTEQRIDELRVAGYRSIYGVFVDIPIEMSVRRAGLRHRQSHENHRSGDSLGGRFVPPEVIRNQANSLWGTTNREVFEIMKSKLDGWAIYDNSLDSARPRLVETSQRRGAWDDR
jgi:predicted ABC-type ATPase